VINLYRFCSADDIPWAKIKNIEGRMESWEEGIVFDIKEMRLPLLF
jgi:hypothetical protein